MLLVINLLSVLCFVFETSKNFEYEYSFILSKYYVLLIPLLSIFIYSKKIIFNQPVKYHLNLVFASFTCSFLLGSLIYYYIGCQCVFEEYEFWYVINVSPSLMLGLSLNVLIYYLKIVKKITNFKLLAGLLGFYMLAVFQFTINLWTHPQKRSIDFLFGFIHGPIYDYWIPVDYGVVYARGAHFSLSLALFFAVIYRLLNRVSRYPAMGFLFIYVVFFINSLNFNSVGHGLEKLEQVLNEKIEHEEFVIHYQKDQRRGLNSSIKNLLIESEFHLKEIKDKLNLKAVPKFHIFAYPNYSTKKILFGGGRTDIADVYTPSIHILIKNQNYPTLRHEIVHVATSDVAYFGLGFHPNMALTEGLAVALAPEFEDLNIHTSAQALLLRNEKYSLKSLFTPYFWSLSGKQSYTMAGSFLDFLLQKYNSKQVISLYSGLGVEEVFSTDMKFLEEEWLHYIQKKSKGRNVEFYTDKLFYSPGVLHDICPHSRENLKRDPSQYSLLSFRQPHDWNNQTQYLPWLLKTYPVDKRIKLFAVEKKIQNIFSQEQDLNETIKENMKAISIPSFKSIEDIELAILLSDFWYMYDPLQSKELLNNVIKFSKIKYIGENLQRSIFARKKLSELSLPKNELIDWRLYLAGMRYIPTRAKRFASLLEEPWLLQYLRLRNSNELNTISIDTLDRMYLGDVPQDFPKSFETQWFHIIAEKMMNHQSYKTAALAWKKASHAATEGAFKRYQQLSRMSLFYSEKSKYIKF